MMYGVLYTNLPQPAVCDDIMVCDICCVMYYVVWYTNLPQPAVCDDIMVCDI